MARFSVKDNSGAAFLKFENFSDIVLTSLSRLHYNREIEV